MTAERWAQFEQRFQCHAEDIKRTLETLRNEPPGSLGYMLALNAAEAGVNIMGFVVEDLKKEVVSE